MSKELKVSHLSDLTKPIQLTDKAKVNKLNAISPGSFVYVAPEDLPQIPNLREVARKQGIIQPDPEAVREEASRLSKLTR